MQVRYKVGDATLTAGIEERDGTTVVRVDDREIAVDEVHVGERFITLRIADRTHRLLYCRRATHVHVAHAGRGWEFVPAEEARDESVATAGGFTPEIASPMPGKVLDVFVSAGDVVEADQALVLLEAMKMEQTVRSRTAARVTDVRVEIGSMVGPGEVLVVLEAVD
jgi:biotin carboxyl carrier protein